MTITACECTTTTCIYMYIYTLLRVDDVFLYIIASVFEPESYPVWYRSCRPSCFGSTAQPPRQRRFEIHGPRRSRKWQRGLEATWRRETWREGWVWDARDPRVYMCIYICTYTYIQSHWFYIWFLSFVCPYGAMRVSSKWKLKLILKMKLMS